MAWIAQTTAIPLYMAAFEVEEEYKQSAFLYRRNPDHWFKNKPYPIEIFPPKMLQISRHKVLPDFLESGALHVAVSQTFKDILESLEPGLHQFQPVEVITRSGAVSEMQFYYFRNLQCLDGCVDYEQSILSEDSIPGRRFSSRLASFMDDELVMKKDVINGRHFWMDKQRSSLWFFSEDLQAEVERQKLKKLRYIHIREV
ncbi:MAG: DUF1629 domain-containing protein [Pseudomonadota bacterium]